MSAPLSPSNGDSATPTIPSPAALKSAGDTVLDPSPPSDTQAAVEIAVTSPDEQRNEQTTREGTQIQRISSYTEQEKNEIKESLWHHFEADDIQQSRTTSGTVLNDHGKRLTPNPDYTWKIEEARRRREQAIIRSEKRARVSQQAQSSWSLAARNRSQSFVLFQVQQRQFCTSA